MAYVLVCDFAGRDLDLVHEGLLRLMATEMHHLKDLVKVSGVVDNEITVARNSNLRYFVFLKDFTLLN